MTCPYCNGEMVEGRLISENLITGIPWYPKGLKVRRFFHKPWYLEKNGGYNLADHFSPYYGYSLEAHICKDCKKVICDFSDSRFVQLSK